MRILTSNLITALQIAISDRREVERQMGYMSDSIFVAGLIEVLEAAQRGERITVSDD